ncbi:hypothetical protein BMETH_1197_0 [methanotrophic bacterial endosymbiont of Bathymodiolus sp.]|nr:hypothetical protein BMETH_1197_0 [methanotrophic bacterial endosymbiont of Bathymodiolus sp.]
MLAGYQLIAALPLMHFGLSLKTPAWLMGYLFVPSHPRPRHQLLRRLE